MPYIHRSTLLLTILLLLQTIGLYAKNSDSVSTATEQSIDTSLTTTKHKPKKTRNLRLSALGGPGYTPDFGFVLGGSSLLTFSTNPRDTNLLRSVVPLAFALTFNKKIGFNLVFNPQIYFNADKFRLTGRITYKNTVDNYYGVGYHQNSSIERSDTTTSFYNSTLQINPIAYFRIPSTDLFVGPMLDFNYEQMSQISDGVANDPDYIQQGGTKSGLNIATLLLGAAFSYDTRDVPANAYKGKLFDLRIGYSPDFFGQKLHYGILQFDYRQYYAVGNRRTLAWTVNTKNAFGKIPLTRLPFTGSPFDLRGYYLGQYRDKSSSLALLEYRHMINTDKSTLMKRLISRVGFVTWAGAGVVGPSIPKIEAILPNLGAGLRIEVQPRMNFRFDLGFSPLEKQMLMYFNMTEAF
ncbi:MAG: BamA/TamA family outer membrane protein [Bacteroidales bacterium]